MNFKPLLSHVAVGILLKNYPFFDQVDFPVSGSNTYNNENGNKDLNKEVLPNEISRVGPAKHKRGSSTKTVEAALFLDKVTHFVHLRLYESGSSQSDRIFLHHNGIY